MLDEEVDGEVGGEGAGIVAENPHHQHADQRLREPLQQRQRWGEKDGLLKQSTTLLAPEVSTSLGPLRLSMKVVKEKS